MSPTLLHSALIFEDFNFTQQARGRVFRYISPSNAGKDAAATPHASLSVQFRRLRRVRRLSGVEVSRSQPNPEIQNIIYSGALIV